MESLNNGIAVVMATYNGSRYLREQLDSILNQSVSVDEIVIVDDCSSDDTIKIINEYRRKYSFIYLIQNVKNIGVVKTFEAAINNCKGQYILFADQDDVWFKDKVEILISNIGDNLLIYSDAVVVDKNLNKVLESNLFFYETAQDFLCFRDYLFGNNVTGCTMMVNRDIFASIIPIPEFRIMFHDQYLALYASYKRKIKRVVIPLMFYRQHDKNVAASFQRVDYQAIIVNSERMMDDLVTIRNLELYQGSDAKNDLSLAIDFFLAMAHKRYPSIKLLLFCKRKFTTKRFFWFIRVACLGEYFAKLNYNLAPLKTKIKKWLS